MRAAPFTYHRPRTLAEALALTATLDDARVLAGGQTLMPMVAIRVAQPAHVVDLNAIGGLDDIVISTADVTIGAMARQTTIARDERLAARVPLLREALAHVGHRATRNRGTLGGSLCHLDPAAELPVVMAALDARLTLAGTHGSRDMSFAAFAADALSPALRPGEILTRITFALPPPGSGQAFVEAAPRFAATALVTVAAVVTLGADGRILQARVALGGATAVPTRLAGLEDAALGASAPPPAEQVATLLAPLDMLADPLVPAAYRRHVATALVRRALATAFARAAPSC